MDKKQSEGFTPLQVGCFLVGVVIWFVAAEYGSKH
jgi:hypothetical protein